MVIDVGEPQAYPQSHPEIAYPRVPAQNGTSDLTIPLGTFILFSGVDGFDAFIDKTGEALMNFINDLCKIAKQILDHYGVDSSSAETDRDFIQMWMNLDLKLIPQQKYQVFRSKTLTSKSLSQDISDGIDSVQKNLSKESM